MPSWLVQLLVGLAIKIGVPALVKYFPKIPSEIIAVINELLDALKKPETDKAEAKRSAIRKVKECSGVACKSELKK